MKRTADCQANEPNRHGGKDVGNVLLGRMEEDDGRRKYGRNAKFLKAVLRERANSRRDPLLSRAVDDQAGETLEQRSILSNS
jgi:hypothetical protein